MSIRDERWPARQLQLLLWWEREDHVGTRRHTCQDGRQRAVSARPASARPPSPGPRSIRPRLLRAHVLKGRVEKAGRVQGRLS